MTLTFRTERADKHGHHNDRKFPLANAYHIDPTQSKHNMYWTYNGNTIDEFSEIERNFYEDHFAIFLEKINNRKIENKNRDRVMTIDEFRCSKRYQPEDLIIQLGDIQDHVTGEQLWTIVTAYAERFDRKFGENCKILDMALHLDEATPHVHIRRVWIAHDEDGHEFVSQKKALEEMSVVAPDCDKPISRYNNEKMSFSYDDRQLMIHECEEHGIDIDAPAKRHNKHLSSEKYKNRILWEGITAIEEYTHIKFTAIKEILDTFKKISETVSSLINHIEQCPILSDAEIEEGRKHRRIAEKLAYYIAKLNAYIHQLVRAKDLDDFLTDTLANNMQGNYIRKIGEQSNYEAYAQEELDKLRHSNDDDRDV